MKLKLTLLFVIAFSLFTVNRAAAQGCEIFVTVGQGYIHSCGAPIEINPHGGGTGSTYTLAGPNPSRSFAPITEGHWHFSDATAADAGVYTLTATGGHTGGGPNQVPCGTVTMTFTLNITGCCVAPGITCGGNINAFTTEACNAVVNYPAPVVTGTNPTVTYSIPSGSLFPLGTTRVTATATNSCGTATCSFDVTVTDNINPTITAPANITLNANNTGCTGLVDLGVPVTNDNCSVASVTNNAPAVFPVGTTNVTWTVTDGSGNTATATQSVTVINPVTVSVSYTESAYGVLYGYAPMSKATLKATGTGGTLSYAWTPATNLSNAFIANPIFTATAACSPTFQVTATNSFGCTATASQYICVKDVSDPDHAGKVLLCHNGNTISIAPSAVAAHLAHLSSHADTWGPCGATLTCAPAGSSLPAAPVSGFAATTTKSATATGLNMILSPNPFNNTVKVNVTSNNSGPVNLAIYDANGKMLENHVNQPLATDITAGKNFAAGMYIIEAKQGNTVKQMKLMKF